MDKPSLLRSCRAGNDGHNGLPLDALDRDEVGCQERRVGREEV